MTPQSKSMEYDVPIISARYGRKFVRFMKSKGIGMQSLLEGSDIGEDVINV